MKSVGNFRQLLSASVNDAAAKAPAIYVHRSLQQPVSAHGYGNVSSALVLHGTLPEELRSGCLMYRSNSVMDALIAQIMLSEPDFATTSGDGTRLHQLWRTDELQTGSELSQALSTISSFYALDTDDAGIAPRSLPFTILVADNQLTALPCHRLLADLGDMDVYEFLQRLQKCFNIRTASGLVDAMPCAQREFGLYVGSGWYHLRLIAGTWFADDPVSDLDVSVVHDNAIVPMLGISHPADPRIAFTGSQCDVTSLQDSVDCGQWQAAWLMPRPDLRQLMLIADQGRNLPAHSVCFRPVTEAAAIAELLR